ncbi:hydroxyneurosporene methyltransferase-like protein [Dinothrombium tinctorium]|uniref:Acetylserotonin O-methyltransferase n=1 Tax=Dinothrombium tinctorium TaxID=1965070 RepID=A0A3S4R7K9_9ACAR|nr:hydroxyneurosporene methyltransferase-like protein [Dinothrombium tinctorium]RWS12642.1 hydroxyneurosporene methyltransferase-like protein [Dinothrombium tinctorium]
MLRYLVSMKILDENENIFSVTSCGSLLATNDFMKYYTLLMEIDLETPRHFDHMLHTGEVVFDHLYGMNYFDYVVKHWEYGDLYWKMLRAFTSAKEIVAAYDFSQFEHIVDVGGGEAELLIAILKKATHARGTLFETPKIVKKAVAAIAENDLSDRCKTISGSFFDGIPIEGDCYILKHILHDWDDEKCLQILRNIKASSKANSKLVIIDGVSDDDFTKMSDFSIWISIGGKERNLNEFKHLLNKTGFEFTRVFEPSNVQFVVIEAVSIA